MRFDPEVFGMGFHAFVQTEMDTIGIFLAPVFHITAAIVLFLLFWRGNKFRKLATVYFTINWLFLLGYWGIYASIYWAQMGTVYFLNFLACPVLLACIVLFWIRELVSPQIDFDFSKTARPRLIVLLILIWGFVYPSYIYAQGFVFSTRDLLFSNYGLMPCPTTMVALSLFTLNYPKGNRILFKLMTAYAIFIGTAVVAAGWLPDVPFVALGVYSFLLILIYKIRAAKESHGLSRR